MEYNLEERTKQFSKMITFQNSKFKIQNYSLIALAIFVFFVSANQADASAVINTSHVSLPSNNLGLVLYHTFDGAQLNTTTSTDSSGQGNNGSLSGGPTKVAGKLGQALKFDGVNDQVVTNQLTQIEGSSQVTLSMWVYQSSYQRAYYIVKDATNDAISLQAWDDQKIYFSINGITSRAVTTAAANPLNAWFHLVATYDGNTMNIYINGVVMGTSTRGATTVPDDANNLIIGGATYFLNGKMDDVRIYNRVLSVTEIANMYRSGSSAKKASVSNKGLVGYWRFNEGVGSTAVDTGSYKHNGLLIPGASGTNTTSSQMWTTGKFSGGLSFDGTDDYVSSTDTGFPSGSSGKTIHAWVKTTTKKNYSVIFRYGTATAGNMFWMAVNSGGNITITQHGIGLSSFGVDVANGAWHQIDVTSLGNDYIIYIDGVSIIADALTTSLVLSGTASIGASYGGGDQTGYEFNGKIDDVRIYSRVLSPTEIMSLYTDGSTARMTKINTSPVSVLTSGLVGYWTFDGPDTTTTTTNDRSGQGNTGTLTNGPTPVSGRRGQALKFDGVNDYVNVGTSASLTNLKAIGMTIGAWVNPRSSASMTIVSKWSAAWKLQTDCNVNGCSINFNHGGTISDLNVSTDKPLVGANTWQYIAMTWDGTNEADNVHFYYNGVLQPNVVATDGGSLRSDSGHNMNIAGTDDTGGGFNGSIDDVRIYNRALSAEEVKQLYQMGK